MRILPRTAVLLAGKGAWLSAVPAFFLLLVLFCLVQDLCRQLRPGEGMAGLFLRYFGPVVGRLVLLLYGLWFLFYTGFVFRSGAERLADTVYHQSGLDPFILVMAALCLLVSLGTIQAASRTAVLLRALLLGVLAGVFILSIPNLNMENLFPLDATQWPGIGLGSWAYLSVGAVGAYLSFLEGYVTPSKSSMKWFIPTFLLLLALASILCFQVVGTFGENLSMQMSYPFFTMVRDVSLFNLAQRFEAVVIVFWVLADFMLCTILLRCANEAIRPVFNLDKPDGLPLFSLKKGRWLLWVGALAAYGCSHLLAPSSYELISLSNDLLPIVSNILVFGGFSLLWLVGKLRHMDERKF
jgi:spore germination protein KB